MTNEAKQIRHDFFAALFDAIEQAPEREQRALSEALAAYLKAPLAARSFSPAAFLEAIEEGLVQFKMGEAERAAESAAEAERAAKAAEQAALLQANTRRYFPTQAECEAYLGGLGFRFFSKSVRFAWRSADGMVGADIRFSGLGFFAAFAAGAE